MFYADNLALVKNLVEKGIPGATVEVSDLTGTGDHLNLVVVSEAFRGLSLVKQHRLVMDILKIPLQKEVHALKLKTITPDL